MDFSSFTDVPYMNAASPCKTLPPESLHSTWIEMALTDPHIVEVLASH
jgi:hypothetical protein